MLRVHPTPSPRPTSHCRSRGGTYEAVRVLRARAAARTLVVAALVGVGPEAVTVTLGGADGLGHCGGEEAQLSALPRPCSEALPHPLAL